MTDIREALEDAYTEAESEQAEAAQEQPETEQAPEEVADAPADAPAADADAGGEPEPDGGPAAEVGGPEADAAESPGPESTEHPAVDDTPPPVSWNAEEREFWSEATPKVRAAIERREQDMNNILNKTAPVRKFGETMQEVIAPHEQMLASQGSNPVQAVQRMLGVADGLTRGNPQQKATMVAQLMQQYNVDVQTLADVIGGVAEQAPQNDIAQQVEAQVQQRMQPFEQQQMQVQQAAAERVQQELQTFAKEHEFYNDVRLQMADVMDLKEAQGESITLDQAYELAVQLNPTVTAVRAQRAEKERQSRQNAAVSMRPGGGAPPPQGHADTLRGNLLDAWDENVG